jgi:hypothetical protein
MYILVPIGKPVKGCYPRILFRYSKFCCILKLVFASDGYKKDLIKPDWLEIWLHSCWCPGSSVSIIGVDTISVYETINSEIITFNLPMSVPAASSVSCLEHILCVL